MHAYGVYGKILGMVMMMMVYVDSYFFITVY